MVRLKTVQDLLVAHRTLSNLGHVYIIVRVQGIHSITNIFYNFVIFVLIKSETYNTCIETYIIHVSLKKSNHL